MSPFHIHQLFYSHFYRSTKNFMKKYNLDLVAATFIILDSNEASMQVSFAKRRKSEESEFLTEC